MAAPVRNILDVVRAHHVTRNNTPTHSILSIAPQLSISQKALGTLPEDGNVIPKHMIYIYIYIFNRNLVDTRWQPYMTHLHSNNTQNTQKGEFGQCGPCPVFASYTLA